jgi:hypothetical protein
VTGDRPVDGDAVASEVEAQLDELLGPVPEPVETAASRTHIDDGASDRLTRESPARVAGG